MKYTLILCVAALVASATLVPRGRAVLATLNVRETSLLAVGIALAAASAIQALSHGHARRFNLLARINDRYKKGWHKNHRMVRGIALALGGLPGIADELTGDELTKKPEAEQTKTWTVNDVLDAFGIGPVEGGGTPLVVGTADKGAPTMGVNWNVNLRLADSAGADLFARAIDAHE